MLPPISFVPAGVWVWQSKHSLKMIQKMRGRLPRIIRSFPARIESGLDLKRYSPPPGYQQGDLWKLLPAPSCNSARMSRR